MTDQTGAFGLDGLGPAQRAGRRVLADHRRPLRGRARRRRLGPRRQHLLLPAFEAIGWLPGTHADPAELHPCASATAAAIRGASAWQTSTPASGPPFVIAVVSVPRSSVEKAFAVAPAHSPGVGSGVWA
ncbi:MAG: hypothetical protein MUE46_09560 [Xanthomonadales bacterium]|nr:hypothetical protein [Xanthomonadales bacterium]